MDITPTTLRQVYYPNDTLAKMKNWSTYIQWNPQEVVYPESEQAIQACVHKAIQDGKKIRIIGAGHSFTPLSKTDEILVSLDQYQGLIQVDKEKKQAKVKAGTKLFTLGDLLFEQGLAMENLGDIDRQSIAGTISTGTHGTGLDFGTISTQIRAIRFVNGKGEMVSCSEDENQSLFKSAQVSLGTLGIITEITLQCVPAYKLALQNRKEPLAAVLSSFRQRCEENRNFEFYWFPYTQSTWTKSSNIVTNEADKNSFFNYFTEYVLENYAYKVLCEIAHAFPSQNERVAKISAASIANVKKVYHSHKVYATQRLVKFNEMEYNIPIDAHEEVLKEVVRLVNSKRFNIHFPIENRVVKGDDIHMSPAYGRDSAYIACHAYSKKDPLPFFKALEEIFRAHGGRPHWGKMNTLKTEDITQLYPEFGTFLQHRAEQDPSQLFLNPYLKTLLGLA